jgi:Glycosyl hydrolase family 115/Gylcosyl hydrolase family 115 C-terminal domain
MRTLWMSAILMSALGASAAAAPRPEMASASLFDGHEVASIVCDMRQNVPLSRAAGLLAGDLAKLTGRRPSVVSSLEETGRVAIMVGLASDTAVATLLKANNISTAPIDGKWETYGRVAVPDPDNAQRTILVIFGSDTRGAIWGVIDLTRELGISAWEWWADVAPRRVARSSVTGALRYSKEPSVKYRGIFLNDEDWGLLPWAAKTYDPRYGNIGPKTYARIFELLWRLKANTFWPAMHPVTNPFNSVPGNAEMAASFALIHGSSHAEPLLRANEREWDEKQRGPFNYLTNKDNLLRYWDEIVSDKRSFENLYSVGLRGAGDAPMEGAATPRQAASVLSDVIAEQRRILETHIGKPADRIPQTLTPYKEVLLAYDAGVKLPADITITWPDDNHGYIRRLSNSSERTRSGGAGVYYHISYWGAPMSYLWLATTHPALIWEEMDKAYRFDARRIWIVNVGDIKPGEYLTQLLLDMAFDKGSFPDIGSARTHLQSWMARTFGPQNAAEISGIMWRYYDLSFTRRPEFMGWNEIYPNRAMHPTPFNVADFGDENARRLRAYREIASRARRLAQHMAADRRDAFFELVQYPVEAAAAFNERVLSMDKALAYGLQHRASANQYAAQAEAAEKRIAAATHYYNTTLAHGKWRHMMDAAPQRLDQFDAQLMPAWSPGATTETKQCGLQAEGGTFFTSGVQAAQLPVFRRELPRTRNLDIFARAPANVRWTARPSAPWIRLTSSAGRLTPTDAEARLQVSIDGSLAPSSAKGNVSVACGNDEPMIVNIEVTPPASDKVSFVEDNRIVSLYASHADSRSAGWEDIKGLGHTGTSLRSTLDTPSRANLASLQDAPHLTYRFATTTYDDPATLSVVALPMAPVTSENGMRIAVSLDNRPFEVMDFSSVEFSETWRQNVLSNTAIGTIKNLRLAKGPHELSLVALDPGVVLDRIQISFAGANEAYGAVPETRIIR